MTISDPTMTDDQAEVVVVDGYVPVLDISGARSGDPAIRQAVAAAIDTTCRSSGFLVITGHSVDPELVDHMHEVSLRYFEQPKEVKQRDAAAVGSPTLRGYYDAPSYVSTSEGIETPPDICELYTMCRLGEPDVAAGAGLGEHLDVYGDPNVWPADHPEFAEVWHEYYAALEQLSADLMQLFALGLGLDEHFFDDLIDEHITNLVANYYPAIDTDPLPGQYRKGPHSDWGTLTVLYQDDVGGLEVLDRDADEWLPVPVVPGAFVVNIGDLMSIWTNDQWRSTKHRVLVPEGADRAKARVSIPFFHQPNWGARIECLPSCTSADDPPHHDPVESGAYLLAKVQAAYN
ncbi:MAG: isopenicillin N synthase family dioxygenase [Acidimicrobiales bacterium]